eukprot:6575747-Pyramimonas_sp.AAC.3
MIVGVALAGSASRHREEARRDENPGNQRNNDPPESSTRYYVQPDQSPVGTTFMTLELCVRLYS